MGRAKLLLLCHLLYTSNARCEVGNAHLRRWVKSREQTHRMIVLGLSSFWISERVRSSALRSPCSGATRADGQRRPPNDADDPTFKRRKRCGGAWRAFLREQATSNLRRAAEEYRNLGLAERGRLREIGAAATRDGRAGRAEGTSFGLSRREAERRHKQRLAFARIQRFSAEMAGVSVDAVLALAAQDTDPALMSVQLCRHSRALAATERATLDDDVRAIQSFQEANNNVVAATIIAAAPTLAPIAHSVCAVPPAMEGIVVASLAADASARAADAVLHWSTVLRHTRSERLSNAARDHWVGAHELVCSTGDGEAFVPPEDEAPISPCFRAGVCICSADGRRLHTFRNIVLQCIKRACPRGDIDRRHALTSQEVFIKFECMPLAPDGQGDPEAQAFWGMEPIWGHVSEMSLSPYIPQMQAMRDISNTDEAIFANPFGDEIALKATVCGTLFQHTACVTRAAHVMLVLLR